jgi:hypothetical protein
MNILLLILFLLNLAGIYFFENKIRKIISLISCQMSLIFFISLLNIEIVFLIPTIILIFIAQIYFLTIFLDKKK